jgi:5-methylcytosine-specific restriction endonuclease McrA
MSRARPVVINGAIHFFDVKQNSRPATPEQIALLADAENIEIEELLEASLTQGEVLTRIREATGKGEPPEVKARREERRKEQAQKPKCRICGREGNSTDHHFVNKWIMKELSNYAEYASRRICTIPLCEECHADQHRRDRGPHSIVPFLNEEEKHIANILLDTFRREHGKTFEILSEGDDEVYEARLIKDWLEGRFDPSREGNPGNLP